MRVAVSGATGFIGRALVRTLLDRGDDVLALSRRPEAARRILGEEVKLIRWSPEFDPAWGEAIEGYDAVINLAGEPIFGRRWTRAQKRRILKSRAESAAGMIKAIRRADHRPDVLINASAIGYYGPQQDERIDESAPPGEDFLAEVSRAWEEEVEDDDTENVRTVRIRIGVALGPGGGALKWMAAPFRMFLGGPIGSGRQWISWIHIDDLVGIFLLALENPRVEGPLNATAPEPVTNREFARTLGQVLGRPSWLPTPGIVLRLAFGQAADVIRQGQRVWPRRVLEMGYRFRFASLAEALQNILRPAQTTRPSP